MKTESVFFVLNLSSDFAVDVSLILSVLVLTDAVLNNTAEITKQTDRRRKKSALAARLGTYLCITVGIVKSTSSSELYGGIVTSSSSSVASEFSLRASLII